MRHRWFGSAAPKARTPLSVHSVISCSFLLLLSPAHAITDTPYQAIVDRNVFALKPPPPPPVNNPEANKPPPPPITLTGITTILNSKRAFISVNMPAKPPEPAKVQSFMLREGERDGDIEVLEIDEKAGMVKVNEFGTITNLTWEKNGLKMAGGQAAPAPNPAGGVPPPPQNPFNPGAAGFNKAIPSRTLRLPGVPTAQPSTGAGQSSGVNPTAAGGLAAAPSTAPATGNLPGGATSDQWQAAAQRTPEENVLLYEANRIKNQQLIDSGVHLPRMPQHPYAAGLDQGSPARQTQQTPAPTPFSPFAPGQPPPLPQ
jgi:hypothetical protein